MRKHPKLKLPGRQEISRREFHHQVAALKKAGILSPKINALKQAPTRYMLRKLAVNQDVVQGKARGVKVSKQAAMDYKDKGYRVSGSRVILPKDKYTKYTVDKKGRIHTKYMAEAGNIDEIKIPLNITTMRHFLDTIEERAPDFNKLIGDGYRLGFRIGGNFSLQTFPNFQAMLDYLRQYESIRNSLGMRVSRDEQAGLISALEFVRTPYMKLPPNARSPKPPRYIPYSKRLARARRAGKTDEFRAKRAAKAREYRQRPEVRARETEAKRRYRARKA